jgi:hypothetical protein
MLIPSKLPWTIALDFLGTTVRCFHQTRTRHLTTFTRMTLIDTLNTNTRLNVLRCTKSRFPNLSFDTNIRRRVSILGECTVDHRHRFLEVALMNIRPLLGIDVYIRVRVLPRVCLTHQYLPILIDLGLFAVSHPLSPTGRRMS